MNYIKGNYRRSIFTSDKGYVIGIFKVKDTSLDELADYINKTITFTGYFDSLNDNDTYILYGDLVNHPRYGIQFQVSSYEKVKPEDRDGIIEFLASDLFPGIGEKMAETIVATLGIEVLDLVLKDPTCLEKVPKLNIKKRTMLVTNLSKYENSHKTIVSLSELGFNMKDSLAIYNVYKTLTMDKINSSIYRIIDEVPDMSFLKIDEIALALNYKVDDPERIKACIIYIMNNMIFKTGDTYLLAEDIYNITIRYLKLDIDIDTFKLYLEQLSLTERIYIDGDKYYLIDTWKSEQYIIDKITKLVNMKETKTTKLDNYIEHLESVLGITYNKKQIEAIKKAINQNVLIITGGPGTGKTTIIKAIVEIYQTSHKYSNDELMNHIALLAPTGRASKRMAESCNLGSSTIHRFLKWNKENNEFAVNEFNKDTHDMIIVDEVSMIDEMLFDSLLKGTKNDIKLILVGDYNQLPSVGPGEVLKDLIDSEIIDTVYLDLLYRQDENSYINTLACEIKDNDLSENFLDTRSDYTFLECNPSMIKESLKNICSTIIDKGYNYRQVQLMAPMYKGENGIDNLNKELQSIFNPPDQSKREVKYGDVIYRENDKILQLVNMPDENVYNGDIGIIKYIVKGTTSKSGHDEIYVDYDSVIVKYQPKDFNKITHGFIISIHKSQGSEFDIVIIPLCHNYNRMLYRKLIYTGITRAKKKLILVGEASSLVRSIANDNEDLRKSDLANKLKMYNIS